ncbi:RsiV family protein [uncultured Marixanthomonas sp.]|uniref:RsiV family protein n=1 Tax=uncultured Marixanthomonas sp. TaxID=757245 RepID=UPI0030DD77A5|tara:strand:+ start:49528 stop:50397 length:870 start_codon:yes stop_codon:yes gene_type:complete
MRILFFYLSIFLLFACKNEPKQTKPEKDADLVETTKDTILTNREDIELKKQQSIILKQETLKSKPDEKFKLQELIITKSFKKEADLYTLDFNYPLLNEKIKASYANFSEYINDYYVDITGVEAGILEDAELICDTIATNRFQEKRIIDYKINSINDKLISVLFYKENFYGRTLHPSYSFDCVNFDLEQSVFMNYEDFFVGGSEEELREILNNLLVEKINAGDVYYDCWEITSDDFFTYKNNFVVNDTYIEYYFDDCVICPSYTGSYSIKIPLERLMPILRKSKRNPLFG